MNKIKLIPFSSAAVIALSLMLCSFTQEYLIFIKNLGKYNFISMDNILTESGLSTKIPPQKPLPDAGQTNSPVIEQPLPEENIQISIPGNNDFSINISQDTNMSILKSSKGDSRYNADSSDPGKGLFLFHSGLNDSKIIFQSVNSDGLPVKNINYYVIIIRDKAQAPVQGSQTNLPPQQNMSASSAEQSPAVTPGSQQQSGQQDQSGTNSSTNSGTGFSAFYPASADSLPPSEAVSMLSGVLSNSIYDQNDKNLALYKLIDIEIRQGSYSNASASIANVNDPSRKSLYQARLDRAMKNYPDAVKNYFLAFSGDIDTMTNAVLESESAFSSIGAIDRGSIDSLIAQTKKYPGTNNFYAASLINIARLYQYIPDVYAAKGLLDSIISGNYSPAMKGKAQDAENELNNNFLNYR